MQDPDCPLLVFQFRTEYPLEGEDMQAADESPGLLPPGLYASARLAQFRERPVKIFHCQDTTGGRRREMQ